MGRRKEEGPNKTEREGGGRQENGGITDKTGWRRDKKKEREGGGRKETMGLDKRERRRGTSEGREEEGRKMEGLHEKE